MRITKDFSEHAQPRAIRDQVLKQISLHASPLVLSRPQAAEMLLAAKEDVLEGDSHFPLPSLYSHCERRKGTAPFFTLCLFLCQEQERFYLCSILSFHLCRFLHSFGDCNLMILLFASETKLG